MKKHFYSHLVEIESLFISLHGLDMKREERDELTVLIESTVHHTILEVVLSHLQEGDKKIFLAHVAIGRHDDVWKLLKEKGKNIEKKIQKSFEKLKKDFHTDITKAKNK